MFVVDHRLTLEILRWHTMYALPVLQQPARGPNTHCLSSRSSSCVFHKRLMVSFDAGHQKDSIHDHLVVEPLKKLPSTCSKNPRIVDA